MSTVQKSKIKLAVNHESKPYWEGAAGGQLLIRMCNACGKAHHYPRAILSALLLGGHRFHCGLWQCRDLQLFDHAASEASLCHRLCHARRRCLDAHEHRRLRCGRCSHRTKGQGQVFGGRRWVRLAGVRVSVNSDRLCRVAAAALCKRPASARIVPSPLKR